MKFPWTLTVLTAVCLTGEVTSRPIVSPGKMEKINRHNVPRPYTNGTPEFSCAFATDYVGSDLFVYDYGVTFCHFFLLKLT